MPTSCQSDQKKRHSTPGPHKSVGNVIQCAIDAENEAREIYLQLSRMFAHVPGVSEFWQDLAHDEAKHAYALLKVRKSLSDEQIAAPADEHIVNNIASVVSVQNGISLDTVKTLDEAYEIAHELEYSEMNHIFECLAAGFIKQEDKKRILLSELREHQNKLTHFTRTFGNRAWRREIAAGPVTSVSSAVKPTQGA